MKVRFAGRMMSWADSDQGGLRKRTFITATVLLILIMTGLTPSCFAQERTLSNITFKPGQMEMSILLGDDTTRELAVCLTGKSGPIRGEKVYFNIETTPSKSQKHALSVRSATTGTDGVARVLFTHGGKPGTYLVEAFVPEANNSPVLFTIAVRKRMWLVFLIASLLGATAVFLYGMKIMSDSMQELGGTRLAGILEKFTSNRFSALMVGALITALIQSSSATTVMVVGLINGGVLQFTQSIGIILGANIGTTITAQIVAFKLSDYALIFIAIGFLMSVIPKSTRWKKIGKIILGFGILFFGIKVMADITRPLRTYQPFISLILKLENPVLGVIVGAIFTTMIQSSSAATGVYIALSFQGLMTLEAAIPLIFGANIGTSTTALLASIGGSREAKRAAVCHTLFNMMKVVVFLPIISWYRDLIFHMSPHPPGATALYTMEEVARYAPRQIANAHTIAKIIAVIAALPFTGYLGKLVRFIIPEREDEKTVAPKFLDEDLLKFPHMALHVTRKEVLRIADYTMHMVDNVVEVLKERDESVIQQTIENDEKIDILYKAIRPYLSKLTEGALTKEQAFQESVVVLVAEELENIGDVISKSLVPNLAKLIERNLLFIESDWEHILDFHMRVKRALSTVIECFRYEKDRDYESIANLIERRKNVNTYYKALHIAHLQKFKTGDSQIMETSTIYLNAIADFRQLYMLSTNIAHTMMDYHRAIKKTVSP